MNQPNPPAQHLPGLANDVLFAHTSGPRNASLVLVGEAWGESEAKVGLPFQGAAGAELTRMLAEAGIPRSSCLLTNVFNSRPPNNKIDLYFTNKAGGTPGEPPIRQGKYLLPEHLPDVLRLRAQLRAWQPNLVVALGATACWAILGTGNVTALRGTVRTAPEESGFCKVLPTYHPSAVLRNWSFRPIVAADLLKAARERDFSEIRRPQRRVIVNPTLPEVLAYCTRLHPILSVDIETKLGQITCIGFASAIDSAFVVPFVTDHGDHSYWGFEDELMVWRAIKGLLESPVQKLFQNGLYDLQYLARMGIRPANCTADTMLLHHALYPELKKSLGFLGSIYTNEPAWKLMRTAKTDTVKADE